MKAFTKILKSGVVKYLVIIIVGMSVIYVSQQFSKDQDSITITKEALHENDNASLVVYDFNNKVETEYKEIEYDFSKKPDDPKEELEFQFQDYELSDGEILEQQLFDVEILNRIVLIVLVVIVIIAVVYTRRSSNWKNMET